MRFFSRNSLWLHTESTRGIRVGGKIGDLFPDIPTIVVGHWTSQTPVRYMMMAFSTITLISTGRSVFEIKVHPQRQDQIFHRTNYYADFGILYQWVIPQMSINYSFKSGDIPSLTKKRQRLCFPETMRPFRKYGQSLKTSRSDDVLFAVTSTFAM